MNYSEKVTLLRRRLREMESAVVAFSGGVDSSVLVVLAHEELKNKMIAATAVSSSLPESDRVLAKNFCDERQIPHRFVETDEFADSRFLSNPDDRCYYCKKHLYESFSALADEIKFRFIIEGTNEADLAGHRPGYRASHENPRVSTPLIAAHFMKEDVRRLARELELPTAKKPSTACLSSRVPTGVILDAKVLKRIDMAEEKLRGFGITQIRLRHHGDIARIEISPEEFGVCIDRCSDIAEVIKSLGWRYVTLDLMGYRLSGAAV